MTKTEKKIAIAKDQAERKKRLKAICKKIIKNGAFKKVTA